MCDKDYRFSDHCGDCFCEMNISDYFLVKNELWCSCANEKEMLCANCFEIRLGRKLILTDFKDEKMSFRDEVLKGKTPQEYRYNHYLLWKAQTARKLGIKLINEESLLNLEMDK